MANVEEIPPEKCHPKISARDEGTPARRDRPRAPCAAPSAPPGWRRSALRTALSSQSPPSRQPGNQSRPTRVPPSRRATPLRMETGNIATGAGWCTLKRPSIHPSVAIFSHFAAAPGTTRQIPAHRVRVPWFATAKTVSRRRSRDRDGANNIATDPQTLRQLEEQRGVSQKITTAFGTSRQLEQHRDRSPEIATANSTSRRRARLRDSSRDIATAPPTLRRLIQHRDRSQDFATANLASRPLPRHCDGAFSYATAGSTLRRRARHCDGGKFAAPRPEQPTAGRGRAPIGAARWRRWHSPASSSAPSASD